MSARKVKLVLFSHLLSSRYFPRWRKLVGKVQGKRENRYFPRLTLLSNYCANFSFKSVRASLICLGLNLSGCREIFSSWPQPVETELLFVWMILFPWLLVSKDRKRFWRAQPKLLTTSSSVICFHKV